jgi:hypothetical protein
MVKSKVNSPQYSAEEIESWVKDPSKLPLGFWTDPCLPDPLATEADWRDVDELITKIKAGRELKPNG